MNLKYKWIQLKNWWFFFKRMGQKQCRIKYVHDFPDFPCKICSPDAYKQSEKARKWRKEQRETFKNGYIGELDGEVTYCNEKEYNGGFMFKCGKGCKHDTERKELVGDIFEDKKNFDI